MGDLRMPHARLLVGHEGDAKWSIAMWWVTLLLCENRSGLQACGACKACAKNTKLIHPDVHFSFPVVPRKPNDKPTSADYMNEFRQAILADQHLSYNDWLNRIKAENKQGNITKEECNAIIRKLGMKPFESEYKILVMWLPEFLGNVGNALLKILEEPPHNTYFLLLTERQDHILSTILSRVQTCHVYPYTDLEVKQQLEAREVPADTAESVAFMANGNMNAAEKLLKEVDTGFNPTDHFQQWMRICFKNNFVEMSKWSEETAGLGRENIKAFLSYGLMLVRECFAFKTQPEYNIRYTQKEQEFIRNFSQAIQIANIETLYVEINNTIAEIERNANGKITLLNLSMKLGRSILEHRKAQTLT